jgi:CheY-like chemotaxis protein
MKSIDNLRILVVEDDVSLLQVTCALLERKGVKTFSALDGQKALEVLAQEPVDLVLSDVQMPNMDGVELLAEIRRKNPEIPVVLFITGQAQLDEAESIRLGSSGLLRKPVRIAVLLEKIQSLIDQAVIKDGPTAG